MKEGQGPSLSSISQTCVISLINNRDILYKISLSCIYQYHLFQRQDFDVVAAPSGLRGHFRLREGIMLHPLSFSRFDKVWLLPGSASPLVLVLLLG